MLSNIGIDAIMNNKSKVKKRLWGPGACGSGDWASSQAPKGLWDSSPGCRFGPQLVCIPEATDRCFSFSPPQINKNNREKEREKGSGVTSDKGEGFLKVEDLLG